MDSPAPTDPERSPTPRKTLWTLWSILLSSTLLKFALVAPAIEMPRTGDEKQYLRGARAIDETGIPQYWSWPWDEAHSSPVYPYGLGLLRKIVGPESFLESTLYVQALLSSLTAWLVFLIAKRCFGPRRALASAALVAFMPTMLAYSHYFMSETVYTTLFVGVVALLVTRQEPLSAKRAFLAGLLGGVTALTKSQFLILTPFVILWILLTGRDSLRGAAIASGTFLVGTLLIVLPWTVRNTLRYDHFLLVDSNPGNVLYRNWNVLRPENHDVGMFKEWARERDAYDGEIPMRPRSKKKNVAARNAAEVSAAIAFTLDHPLLFLEHSFIRTQYLVNPTSFLVRGIRKDLYAWLPPWSREGLVWLVLLSTGATLALGVLGLCGRPPTGAALLPALLLLGSTILCVCIVSTSRYRFPMMPLLIPFAVNGALCLPALIRERPRSLWLAAPVLLFMVVTWIEYVPLSL